MTDTPPDILKKQIEIVLSFTPEKRLMCVVEMMDWGLQMTQERLKKRFPDYSSNQLKYELIKEYYEHELSPEFLEGIREKLMPA